MNKRIVLALVVVIVVVSGALAWYQLRNRGASDGRVFISGNIEATEVDLSFRIGGQIKRLPIEEGDRLKAGTIVAELDTDTLLAQQGSAQAEMGAAQAVLDELQEGTRKEQIEAARAALKAAESRMVNAKAEYDRYVPLLKEGAISASTYDTKETSLKVATEDYNNAKEKLRELESGPREEQIRAARRRLDRASWDLKRIELDLQHSVLETPVNGVILVKANELGEVVLPGASVASIAAIDEVWLKGYIGEKYLGRVKLGQQAEITTDSYPGKKYYGRVTFISSRAEFTPKNVQTLEERIKQVYRVKVTIPNPEQELKIGMPAEGYILVDTEPSPRQDGRGREKPSS